MKLTLGTSTNNLEVTNEQTEITKRKNLPSKQRSLKTAFSLLSSVNLNINTVDTESEPNLHFVSNRNHQVNYLRHLISPSSELHNRETITERNFIITETHKHTQCYKTLKVIECLIRKWLGSSSTCGLFGSEQILSVGLSFCSFAG